MDFSKLLEELNSLNLPADQYAITSSGVLAVRGIREAKDLDLVVTDSLFGELAKKYPVTNSEYNDSIKIGNVEILGNFKGGGLYTNEDQIKSGEMIDGHRYVNLDMIIAFKKALGREKDLKDLELIESYKNRKI